MECIVRDFDFCGADVDRAGAGAPRAGGSAWGGQEEAVNGVTQRGGAATE
jgi:hypothetical protein